MNLVLFARRKLSKIDLPLHLVLQVYLFGRPFVIRFYVLEEVCALKLLK